MKYINRLIALICICGAAEVYALPIIDNDYLDGGQRHIAVNQLTITDLSNGDGGFTAPDDTDAYMDTLNVVSSVKQLESVW